MIKLINYSKTYDGKKKIINDMNLHIEQNDLFGFIGHNGAGKTTTLKSISGIHSYSGEILIDGLSLKTNELICKKKMAYIPDNPELYENLTGIQYINLISDLYKIDKDKRKNNIEKYSTLFDIKDFLNNLISSYSHGMKQKLVIIAAMVHEPKILILDEPFVGLDPTASFNLKNIMKEFCDNGGAILFSTHVLEVAQSICNKIAIIKKGDIIVQGLTKDITKDISLEELFLETNA